MHTRTIRNGRYSVSECGKVYSLIFSNRHITKKREQPLMLKQCDNGHGYLVVMLNDRKTSRVHRLVAEGFLPGFSKATMINHIDGNKKNNHISNLELSNNSHNQIHSNRVLGRKTSIKLSDKDFDIILNLWADGVGITKITKITGVDFTRISQLLSHRFKLYDSPAFKHQIVRIVTGFSKSKMSPLRHEAPALLKKILALQIEQPKPSAAREALKEIGE